jgi:flagellar motor protein MotB
VSKHQVDGARLTTEGYGDTRPVEANKTEAGRAKNRRVELAKT